MIEADYTGTGDFVSGSGIAGVADNASANDDIADINDAPAPPAPPDPSLSVYFKHTPSNFSSDYRLDGLAISWLIETDAGGFTNKPMEVTWDVSAVPVKFFDVQLLKWTYNTGTFVWENPVVVVADMRTTSNYQFTSHGFLPNERFSFEVTQNELPVVVLTGTPTVDGGEEYTTAQTIALAATAVDNDGTVTDVLFEYSDDNGAGWTAVQAADPTAPYEASWDITGATDSAQYLVRASATDDKSGVGTDTSAAVFLIDLTAPALPTLLLPANAGFSGDTTPTLDWGDVVDPSGVTYDVQVDDTSAAFGSLVDTGAALAASTHTVGVVLPDGTYYWRVMATDGATPANPGTWSATWSFIVDDTTPPGAPTLSAPADADLSNDTTPTLDWTDVTDPSGVTYDVQVDDTSAAFGSLVVDQAALGTSTYTTGVLPDGTYYWQARAVDSATPTNAGAWTAARSFTIDATAPAVPALLLPADASSDTDTTPTLDWADVTDPNGVTYYLDVDDTDATFGSLVVNDTTLAVSTYTTGVLPDGTYYWRVLAIDNLTNASAWTTPWSFTVDNTAPAESTLVSPADTALINDATPMLDWTDVVDPSGVTYSVQVDDTDATFASLVVDQTGLAASMHTTAALTDGTYYWRVMVTDGVALDSAWTAAWSFTLDATAPAAPDLLEPEEGDIITGLRPIFDWTDVTDPNGVTYTISIGGVETAGLAASTFTPMTDLPMGMSSWMVMAVDGAGNASAWAAPRSFMIYIPTETPAPAPVATPAPTAPPIVDLPPEDAADIIAEVPPEQAADALEETTTEIAAEILGALIDSSPESVGGIMDEIETGEAADIIEDVTRTTSAGAAAGILQKASTTTVVAVMEEMEDATLDEVIAEVSEETLTKTLPQLSVEKLNKISVASILKAMPNAPIEQITEEITPEVLEELSEPIQVYETSTGAKYIAVKTITGEWVVLMATPPPLTKVIAKFNKDLANVETVLKTLTSLPAGTPALAVDLLPYFYFTATLTNATSADIDVVHMGFKVDIDWLEQNGINPWAVDLNRYDEDLGAWVTQHAKKIGEDATYLYYSATMPGLSLFAITGTTELALPAFTVDNLVIPTSVDVGEAVTISIDVTNLASVAVPYAATLWIDSSVEAAKVVSIAGSATETISFAVTMDTAATYNVRIDKETGTLTVAAAPAPTPTPTPTATPTPAPTMAPTPTATPEPESAPLNVWVIIGPILGVLALAVIAVMVMRRRKPAA
ncbi:PGF-pre-PGF domain-containing protein [Chloroflexota bacterium]